MIDIIWVSVPFFLLFILLEAASYRLFPDDDERGYESRDTVTSLALGVLSQAFLLLPVGAVATLLYTAVYAVSPLQQTEVGVWTWVLALIGYDLVFYWSHRINHEVRLFWAHHVQHHSSEFFNLSTALRQPVGPGILPGAVLVLPLALLGVPPWLQLSSASINLVYQFFLHTERIRLLPRPIELVFNTPSHHRVHHGANNPYLDRNYGGVLIVWDRLFGSFTAEDDQPIYGLTSNIRTHNIVRVITHEYVAIWRDVRGADSWRLRLRAVFGRPGAMAAAARPAEPIAATAPPAEPAAAAARPAEPAAAAAARPAEPA